MKYSKLARTLTLCVPFLSRRLAPYCRWNASVRLMHSTPTPRDELADYWSFPSVNSVVTAAK